MGFRTCAVCSAHTRRTHGHSLGKRVAHLPGLVASIRFVSKPELAFVVETPALDAAVVCIHHNTYFSHKVLGGVLGNTHVDSHCSTGAFVGQVPGEDVCGARGVTEDGAGGIVSADSDRVAPRPEIDRWKAVARRLTICKVSVPGGGFLFQPVW